MSIEDEVRYGRTCSLVLNKSVIVLRRVVEHFYTSQGAPNFEVFLNNNKHVFFHLLFKECCCGNKSSLTPLNKTLWQKLYVRSSTTNPHGRRGECPCQYTAICGVTPDVMDITLSCLVIRNACPGVSMVDIDTIREVRNQLIHANNASLDVTEYTTLWSRVENAMLDLAKGISVTFRGETIKSVQELKNRLLDPSELTLLRSLVMDEARIAGLEKDITDAAQQISQVQETLTGHIEDSDNRLHHVDRQIQKLREDQDVLKSRIPPADERNLDEHIQSLKKDLVKMNQAVTEEIPLSPLQKTKKKLPSDLIFAPVVIREDLEEFDSNFRSDNTCTEKKGRRIETSDDLFYKNGESVRNIFMQGDAAHGKTMYCTQLLRYWCTAMQAGSNKEGLSEMERGLGNFDFVFLILLRLVNKTRLSIADMICKDLFKYKSEYTDAILYVLSSDKYRCLILVDGLDEWRICPELTNNLTHKALPDIENLSKCTLLFTFRPWVFAALADYVTSSDRIVHICGLDDDGKEIVTEKVLRHYYNLNASSEEFMQAKSDIIRKSDDKKLKSIMEIPLLLVVSIMLWFEKRDTGSSFTSFYIALVQLVLKRAIHAGVVDQTADCHSSLSNLNIPDIIASSKNRTFRNFLATICSLGEIAYEDTMSDETRLVFGKEEIEDRLSPKLLEFAMKVGLLSQCEAPGIFDEENVSLNFFHKTVQELLTAVYVVCGRKVGINSVCRHLTSIAKIHGLSNVLLFISGMCPSMGCEISKQIVKVANEDPEIIDYRETLRNLTETVKDIYNLQASCFREIKRGLDMTNRPDAAVQFHVADVHLIGFVSEFAEETSEILQRHNESLVSLALIHVPDFPVHGIQYQVLYDLFRNSKSLRTIALFGMRLSSFSDSLNLDAVYMMQVTFTSNALLDFQRCIKRSRQLKGLTLRKVLFEEGTDKDGVEVLYRREPVSLDNVMKILPTCSQLKYLYYCGSTEPTERRVDVSSPNTLMTLLESFPELGNVDFREFVYKTYEHELMQAILKVPRLENLFIETVQLRKLPDDLSCNWTFLRKIHFEEVYMSAANWRKFFVLLLGLGHRCEICLRGTDIDDASMEMIRTSPHTTVTEDQVAPSITVSCNGCDNCIRKIYSIKDDEYLRDSRHGDDGAAMRSVVPYSLKRCTEFRNQLRRTVLHRYKTEDLQGLSIRLFTKTVLGGFCTEAEITCTNDRVHFALDLSFPSPSWKFLVRAVRVDVRGLKRRKGK